MTSTNAAPTAKKRKLIDPHIHQWDPFTTPRKVSTVAKVVRRAPLVLPVLVRVFPRSNREFVGDTHGQPWYVKVTGRLRGAA